MLDLSKDYDHIFNNIDGFFIIDTDEKVVFMCDNLLGQIGKTKQEVTGSSIRDLIPTNKAYKILQTGEKQIGEMYFIEGYTIVSNGYPIYKGGELVGAFEYDVFANIGFVEDFLERVENVGDVKNIVRNKKEYKKAKYSIEDIIGSGPAVCRLREQIRAAAKSNSTVMITGETGSGKELVAHAIHRLSQRSLFHFVRLNCASIPVELFESELFGYEEGSFTGAKKGGKIGKIEIANNGTLFLDEIDNLTLGMQAKILRFLQEKEVLKVGGDFPIPVDTRIIVATNQIAQDLLDNGSMRKDLFYRLNVIEINIPPLRERIGDIPELVDSILDDLNCQLEKASPITKIEKNALEHLMRHSWPGNIRELRNVLERAIYHCRGDILKLEDFDNFIKHNELTFKNDVLSVECSSKSLRDLKREVEDFVINNAMKQYDNHHTKVAKALGISRQMLYKKLNRNKL